MYTMSKRTIAVSVVYWVETEDHDDCENEALHVVEEAIKVLDGKLDYRITATEDVT